MANAKAKKPAKMTCSICGLSKAKSNYFISTRKEYQVSNEGYCPICKKCLSDMLIDMDTKGITVSNFKKVLSYLDMVYIPSLFTDISLRDDINANNFIGLYKKSLNLKREWKHLKFADSVMFEVEHEMAKNEIKKDLMFEITDDMKIFWGHNKEVETYLELQEMYDSFIENEEEEIIDYKKQSDYKTLCELELMKRNMIGNGDKVGDLAKVVDMISKLSSDLNIKAIQKKENNSNRGAYDLFIKKIETTRPVFDFERDLGNKDEVKELLQLYFYGYLLDVNGQKTQFTDVLYQDLSKYTPNLSSYENEEEEDDING